MYYTVYKTTNIVNGKIYIGFHVTDRLDDEYLGSGKILLMAIRKYGRESFTKDILFVFDNSKEMFEKEKELVNEDFCKREDTYNIKLGGYGGWDYLNPGGYIENVKDRPGVREAFSRAAKRNILNKKGLFDPKWDHLRQQWSSESGKISFLGRKHTEETKKKIGEANKRNTGTRNGSFGTYWITNGIENKKIKKDEILPEGYRKGRVM